MDEAQRGYVSYLLRIWLAESNGVWTWRASLQCSQTSQKWHFANLDDLTTFIQKETEDQLKAKLHLKIKEESNES
jgi:hypothetical protein